MGGLIDRTVAADPLVAAQQNGDDKGVHAWLPSLYLTSTLSLAFSKYVDRMHADAFANIIPSFDIS